MDVWETKNMELFNKVHIFEPMKSHICGPIIPNVQLCKTPNGDVKNFLLSVNLTLFQ